VLILISTQAMAINVQTLKPSTGYNAGYSLFTSETLEKNELSYGLNLNFDHHPLEVGVITGNNRNGGLVDRFLTADLLFSFGVTDNITFHVDIPLNIYHDIAPAFIATRDVSAFDAGDLRFSAQIKIFDVHETKYKIGLAVVPYLTVPTGDGSVYFGDVNATGGLVVAVDKMIGKNHLYLNTGFRLRETENVRNLVVKHEFLVGAGIQRPISEKYAWNAIAEIYGSTTFEGFLNNDLTTPVEVLGLVQKKWLADRNLVTQAGVGYGLTNGYGTPDIRVTAGASYTVPLFVHKKPKYKEEPFVFQTVHFPFDSDRYYKKHNQYLNDLVSHWEKKKKYKIMVRGHTDAKGDNEYNSKLAQRRAHRVMGSLIKLGVPSEDIHVAAVGEGEPTATNETDQGRQLNRRVEILFYR